MPSSKFAFALLVVLALFVVLPAPVSAFGAGNIASISKIEGKNYRHGDIEDMLKTVACLRHHKWTSMMIKRVYFGNWLRDYSQAVDVGTLKGVQAGTIRILVWILGFMSFGYATGEFEVTEERLGVYRPEEHIDNPKDYADNEDARKYDPRLRPPVDPIELAIDPNTGMKNYIANDSGGWATSSGYVKYSLTRSIHFGRLYTSGTHKGREEDLCEALRCLGQALHTLEDFGAHSNYTELALREMGLTNVFPHVGSATEMHVRGKRIFPLVTGTFGGVDFLHSVLGEASDHVTQSEVDEVNTALIDAATQNKRSTGSSGLSGLTDILGKVPGTSDLVSEARQLQQESDAQAARNTGFSSTRASAPSFDAPPGSTGGPPGPGIPGMDPNMDPQTVVNKIYPILVFRDKVVRTISNIVSKIPGLENLIDTITERVTLFVLGLLAPFVQPIISAAQASLKTGSSTVIDSSGKHQYEVWTDPHCTDPTHSMLSKDHFSNILNDPAGQVAVAIIQYVAPRVLYAWDHPDVPVEQVLADVVNVFHHPALRDHHNELHRNMFSTVERWMNSYHNRGNLNHVLGSESVRSGKNHTQSGQGGSQGHGHGHGGGGHGHGGSGHSSQGGSGFLPPGFPNLSNIPGFPSGGKIFGLGSHSMPHGSPLNMFQRKRDMGFEDEGPEPAGSSWNAPQDQYGQSGSSYNAQPGYGNQPYQQQGGPGMSSDPYAHQMPTSYQQGYSDGGQQWGQGGGYSGPGYGQGGPPEPEYR